MNDLMRRTREAPRIKEEYPVGTRILLDHMNDPLAPVPAGTRGTVRFVDDAGQIHIKENYCSIRYRQPIYRCCRVPI